MIGEPIPLVVSPAEIAARLQGVRLLSAELMYKPRPASGRERRVFDFTLASRLRELIRQKDAGVLFICNDEVAVTSLAHLPAAYPRLMMLATIVNPDAVPAATDFEYSEIPRCCEWPDPDRWQRYNMSDRWARICFALNVAARLEGQGHLILTAHDAVWGRGLLAKLVEFSHESARNGAPAAVSPYTARHHSRVPGVDVPQVVIDALNAAWGRDSHLRQKLQTEGYQAFWGKTGLLPFALAEIVRLDAETGAWEDDLEIDRVLKAAGFSARALWTDDPALYRLAPPVFDVPGLRRVIQRTLHYSLPIPGAFPAATSLLNQPLDSIAERRIRLSPRFARAVALSERLITDCNREIAARLERYGWSWVDWGDYRYVVRVGDPWVRVWKYAGILL